MLKIMPQDQEVLRAKATPVPIEFIGSEECMKLYYRMIATMRANMGIGLAAPQVGVSNRIFVLENADISLQGHAMFINPEMTVIYSLAETEMVERCLSLPNVVVNVSRADSIKLEYYSFDGEKHTLHASGFKARVIQHEMDHLDGILISDYEGK